MQHWANATLTAVDRAEPTQPIRTDDLDAALIAIDRACGSDVVVRDPDLLERFSHDASEVPPRVPGAVVRPTTTAEVSAILRAANARRVPVTPRGGGTGRVGGAVPVHGGIVLALERMNRIAGVDVRDAIAVVGPGVVTGELHDAVESEGLFYPPDPNSWGSCQIGGNIATNAGGPRAFKYGVTREYVLGLEVVTADGSVLALGRRTPKGVTGYDLTALVVGSEGTLGVVTSATMKLIAKPEAIATAMVFLPDAPAVARAVATVLERRMMPRVVELLDEVALGIVRAEAGLAVPPGARAMLIIELDGESDGVEKQLPRLADAMDESGAIDVLAAKDETDRERLWSARRELSHSMRRVARFKLSEDVVVPRSRMAELLDRCAALAATHGIVMPTYGHAGDGNLHVNLLWNDEDQRPAVDAAIRALFESVVAMGGTLTGEHGLGVLKAPYLPLEQSAELIDLQARIADVFDPKRILNPGKVFPAGHRGC